ncbi:MAG: NAD(P)-dependent oxidoreductase [Burkholderiales bacterium]|nr:NAD(P)-dependent oxidoreductase [Burkholderiales bacterium]
MDATKTRVGWLGTGRMGFDMARRLAAAGCTVTAWNRTRSKAEALAPLGVRIADSPAQLAGCEIVFCMLAAWDDVKAVVLGKDGLLSGARPGGSGLPRLLVDCTSISFEGSAELRAALAKSGVAMLAAPVSGNAKVVKAGKLSFVASGPRAAFEEAAPFLRLIGQEASYVGEGDIARFVKICHNVYLGVVIQSLVEITVLAEKAGVPRHAFLDFLNKSVMGSTFSRYKSPALVNLDFHVTFTPYLLRKDLDLGLEAARRLEVPMPLAAATRELVQAMMGSGLSEQDFSALILQQAKMSGIELAPENVAVDDGLS